jgi:hypothetical protein
MARAPQRSGHAEVFAGLFALSFLAARFLPLLELGWACPFRAATGIPCATCGMTRALVALAHGDVPRALGASPLGALLAAGAWAFALAAGLRLLLGLGWPRLGARAARAAALVGLGALLANWAWLVVAVPT